MADAPPGGSRVTPPLTAVKSAKAAIGLAWNVGQFCPQGQASVGATVGELVEGEPKSRCAQQSEDPVGSSGGSDRLAGMT